MLTHPIVGGIAARGIVNPHPRTVFAASTTKLLPINTFACYRYEYLRHAELG